jgi:hypothetical protein
MTAQVRLAYGEVDRIIDEAHGDWNEGREAIAALPGTNSLCPGCGTRMQMRPVRDGEFWWTLWVCSNCGKRARLADLPRGSLADGA